MNATTERSLVCPPKLALRRKQPWEKCRGGAGQLGMVGEEKDQKHKPKGRKKLEMY